MRIITTSVRAELAVKRFLGRSAVESETAPILPGLSFNRSCLDAFHYETLGAEKSDN